MSDLADINTQSLDEFKISPEGAKAAIDAWNEFINKNESKEAAGELLYTALFDSAPTFQAMFVTPKVVQAMKLMNSVHDLITNLEKPASLSAKAETLGFQHLDLDVTPPRIMMFRNAILDMLDVELAGKFTPEARNTITKLLNYIGGALIFVKTHYSERLKLLLDSWAYANDKADDDKTEMKVKAANSGSFDGQEKSASISKGPSNNGGWFSNLFGRRGGGGVAEETTKEGGEEGNEGGEEGQNVMAESSLMTQNLPTTFHEMFQINAKVMGLVNIEWMNFVVESFDNIVRNVTNSNRLTEEANIVVLKVAKYASVEDVNLAEFKSCMLAALRSLLPKIWTTGHEVAWSWMWENVAILLNSEMQKPGPYELALDELQGSIDENQYLDLRRAVYDRFFELAPAGQEYFKQSTTRLNFIAERVFLITLELYRDPKRVVNEISALGLRHVGFGIPTELFSPYVTASVEILQAVCGATEAVNAYRWSLGLVAKILVRTITEGSTVVMKAINANSVKQLKKAIDCAPRGERALWMLLVQVGAQSISPLSWAIESGSMEVAGAILTDLLTIRADRDRYYYGVNELFGRHPDIVKRLCQEAPMLLPVLLDGLVWRSHRPVDGYRRVNYYVEHMLQAPSKTFSISLKCITTAGDPAIISHPIIVTMSDALWGGIVKRVFIYLKMWNVVSLIIFVFSQGIMPRLAETANPEEVTRINVVILVGRVFIYVFGLGRLLQTNLSRIWDWSKKEMNRIFEEIDEDGNGDIDWEEFVQALSTFRELIIIKFKMKFGMLEDEEKLASSSSGEQSVAAKEKSMATFFSASLFLTLILMCIYEPLLWCLETDDWPTSTCPDAMERKKTYSVWSMCCMAVHWLVLIDMSVFSTEISAFLLVVNHVLQEVRQFLTALMFLLFMFGSAICILCRQCTDEGGTFNDMLSAMISLFAITVRLYQGDFRDMESDPLLLAIVLIFVTGSAVLLLNLLVAQLNLSYMYIYADMLGFARLKRAALIVEKMEACPKPKWRTFIESLNFDKRLEFDEGDLGLAGGIQDMEKAGLHRTTTETIRRFGGTTEMEAPWPEEKENEDGEEAKYDRLEALLSKALKRGVTKRQDDGRPAAKSHGSSGDSKHSITEEDPMDE